MQPNVLLNTRFRDEKWRRFALLALGLWLHAACSMLAATTLPSAVAEIGGGDMMAWAFTLYQLGSILAGAATGLAIARFGFRVSLFIAGSIYTIGSAICAMAGDMELLVAARLVQGSGGGWLVASTFVFVNREFPERMIPKLQAALSAVWTTAAFCGPLIGGSFATYGLWRYAFWAFAVQGLFFIVILLFTFKADRSNNNSNANPFPLVRLSVLAASILSVSFAGVVKHNMVSYALIIAAVALFYYFLNLDRAKTHARMFPRHAFNITQPIGACMILVFAAGASTMTFIIYGPYFLENGFGLSPLKAGYIVLLESVGWGIAAILFANSRRDSLLIRCGVFLITLGAMGFAISMPNQLLSLVIVCALIQGGGFGMMWGFIIKNAVKSVDTSERDITSSALPTTQQISFACGAAFSGLIANALGFSEISSFTEERTIQVISFWVFAAFVPILIFANLAAKRFVQIIGN